MERNTAGAPRTRKQGRCCCRGVCAARDFSPWCGLSSGEMGGMVGIDQDGEEIFVGCIEGKGFGDCFFDPARIFEIVRARGGVGFVAVSRRACSDVRRIIGMRWKCS